MDQLVVYSEEELKKIQQIELTTLKVIVDICEKLNIEYFAIGGTALGAIRHKGFIPWDDDIDIGMTRDHYDRFIREAPSILPSGYYLQTPYDNVINPYPYAKVRVDGTEFVEYINRSVKVHHGIYVDIFPFDMVPDDDEANLKQFKAVRKLSNFFSIRQNPDYTREPKTTPEHVKRIIWKIRYYLAKIVPYRLLLGRIEKEMKRYNGTDQKAFSCLFFPVIKTEYVLKDTLYPLEKHPFEDMEIYLPCDYDTYLTSHYGDYLKLPPISERFGHKPYLVSFGNEVAN